MVPECFLIPLKYIESIEIHFNYHKFKSYLGNPLGV